MPRAEPDINAEILAAHAAGRGAELARLYECAADLREASGEPDAAAFFLTQAYVFSLESGDPRASALRARLKSKGREA